MGYKTRGDRSFPLWIYGDNNMEFGWINVFGAGVVILILIPNIVYAIRNKNEKNLCTNRFMNVIEQIGRYACIILMWAPLFVWKFGFSGVFEMLLYLIGNGCLLTAYWIIFACYLKRKTKKRALALAALPTCIPDTFKKSPSYNNKKT